MSISVQKPGLSELDDLQGRKQEGYAETDIERVRPVKLRAPFVSSGAFSWGFIFVVPRCKLAG